MTITFDPPQSPAEKLVASYHAAVRRIRRKLALQKLYPRHVLTYRCVGEDVIVLTDDRQGTVDVHTLDRRDVDTLATLVPDDLVYRCLEDRYEV